MTENKSAEVEHLVLAQREYFASGRTRDLGLRREQLLKLKAAIKKHEAKIIEGLRRDLNKSEFESYAAEVGFIYEEINHTLKSFEKWAKPVGVATPLLHKPSRSVIYSEPRGNVLVIGPWNYPFQLLISPVVGAIAAGNTAVLKLPDAAAHTSKAVADLIAETFDPGFLVTVSGGRASATALLACKFDYIFFTGGPEVGKVVMTAAAKHLTPVTLELGGKSPCIVHDDAALEQAAKRIVWGKFLNAGQTCVAPDYLLVHNNVKARFIELLKVEIKSAFGESPKTSPDYGRIINDKHHERLVGYLKEGRIVAGGESDSKTRYISPTLLTDLSSESPVMSEEIFGPILPILEYSDIGEAIAFVNERAKPLALYFFSSDKATQRHVLGSVSFGGGCINDVVVHLANPHLPFGGVGQSGMGSYHGKFSFDLFSHKKGVVHKSPHFELKFRYRPYAPNMKWLRRVMK